ncbi:hypothetical protein G7Y89_g13428 [Cudoniella acicularis]|uniref:HpcH/HpaI aldolase/citrate lyase domain-containing protein n=1 Tax=Cudoniella acicularis TaxID=354080 RepID=A0A8H4R9W4_9HELO|nr:hypothetical protein G7Y89_g13428 [Cudoniella acicularis]
MATNGSLNGTLNGPTSGYSTGFKPVDPADVAKLGMKAYRAPSLFQPHRAREALADAHAGKIPPIVGFFCGLSSPPVAKLVALFGFDLVWIDWEHASTNVETMTQMVHDIMFCSEGRSMPFVRVPGHDHAAIGYALDAGASIVVPQVETVEDAKHITSAAKFGKKVNGYRSAPPARWFSNLSDGRIDESLTLHQNLNRQAAIVIQIESLAGIHNLDAILTECGDQIDSVWLGSLDARISMDLAAGGLMGDEEEWTEAVKVYEAALAKHNKPASGLAFGTPEMKEHLSRGRSMIVVAADTYALMGTMGDLAEVRKDYPAMDYSKVYKTLCAPFGPSIYSLEEGCAAYKITCFSSPFTPPPQPPQNLHNDYYADHELWQNHFLGVSAYIVMSDEKGDQLVLLDHNNSGIMASKNPPKHVLYELYLEDLDSVRRVMASLDYYFTNPEPSPHAVELRYMTDKETRTVKRIFDAIQNHCQIRLPLHSSLLFVAAKEEGDEEVEQSIEEYIAVADAKLFFEPMKHYQEFCAAEKKFYRENGFEVPSFKELLELAPAVWPGLLQEMGYSQIDFDDNGQIYFTPHVPGQRVIDDGTLDRSATKINTPDDSKLTITIPVEEVDEKDPTKRTPCEAFEFEYKGLINWYDRASVKQLRTWRHHMFNRLLGSKREAGVPWLEVERDALFDILQVHLKTKAVGGRYSKIDWDFITERLNERFVNTPQKKGMWVCERVYEFLDSNGKICWVRVARQKLAKDRRGEGEEEAEEEEEEEEEDDEDINVDYWMAQLEEEWESSSEEEEQPPRKIRKM